MGKINVNNTLFTKTLSLQRVTLYQLLIGYFLFCSSHRGFGIRCVFCTQGTVCPSLAQGRTSPGGAAAPAGEQLSAWSEWGLVFGSAVFPLVPSG